MYFTSLPDHSKAGFDETSHFDKFGKHNIIFHAESKESHCDDHVGCLSIKTVWSGEEIYGVDGRQLAVRPGQLLILNNDQRYSCRIRSREKVQCFSVFFKNDFASSVLIDALHTEEFLLDNPDRDGSEIPEFYQTLRQITPEIGRQFSGLRGLLQTGEYHQAGVDEHLIFMLRNLIGIYRSDIKSVGLVKAVKASTRREIYRRLCIARDVLHSSLGESLDLNTVGTQAGLSVPQLVRQFKSVFQTTPHQYLTDIRLKQAAGLLQRTDQQVQDVAWACGFENAGAFSRAFRSVYGMQPTRFRSEN